MLLLLASIAGGLTAAVTIGGRTTITSVSLIWLATLLLGSSLLIAWGLLFARHLHRRWKLTLHGSFRIAAACHSPLLMGTVLVVALYSNDLANHVYFNSVHGQVLLRPLVLCAILAVPLAAQLTTLAILDRRHLLDYMAVAAPIGVALILRLWSIDWQLPYLLHNDERGYLSSAMTAWAHGDPNPYRFINPSVMFYLDTALFNLLGGPRAEALRVFSETLGITVWDPRGMYFIALASRSLVALSGAATIAVVYLSTKLLFDRKTALLASWFLAFSFLHVRDSHYGTNDIMATFFAATSFLFAARLYRSGRWSDYWWAGVMGGLGTSTKYNVGLFIFPILVAHLAGQRGKSLKSILTPLSIAPLLMSYAASALFFVVGTPYSLLDWRSFSSGFTRQFQYGGSVWFGQEMVPVWWKHLTGLVHGFGLIPLALVAIAILYLARRDTERLILVIAFPAIYLGFMLTQQLYFVRFSIPALPFLAILAGYGATLLLRQVSPLVHQRAWTVGLMIIALSQTAVFSVQVNMLLGTEDTRVLADRWISENIPEGGLLLVDDISDLRRSQGWPSRQDLRVEFFDPKKDPTPWKSAPDYPAYLVVTSFGYDGLRRGASETGELPEAYRAIDASGSPVATFVEGRGQKPVGYSQDDTYTPFWYVLERERPGPTVRIYRFGSDQ